jgi:DNA-binding GntR family transcriptional regulator
LPAIVTAADVVAALAAVTAAMSAGKISPAEAVEIAAVIETVRRAIETQDVETRLHALEEHFK